MSLFDSLFGSDEDNAEEPEDRTFTFTGFSTPQFEQSLQDMRDHFGDGELLTPSEGHLLNLDIERRSHRGEPGWETTSRIYDARDQIDEEGV